MRTLKSLGKKKRVYGTFCISMNNDINPENPILTQKLDKNIKPKLENEKAPHRKIEKIKGMKYHEDKPYFLVKYADSKTDEVVDGAFIRKHNQKALLNFYEEYIQLVEVNCEPENPQSILEKNNNN